MKGKSLGFVGGVLGEILREKRRIMLSSLNYMRGEKIELRKSKR